MNGFALWLGIGSVLGMWRIARSAPQQQETAWVNTALIVLLSSLVGARLFYVVVNWGYFAAHLIEAPQIWLGGLGWPGAIAGAWLALIYLAITIRASRYPVMLQNRASQILVALGWLGDRLHPMLPPIAITAWLGCWQAGIAYGPSAPAGTILAVPSLDETGVYNLHWPLQPAAAALLILFFAVLETQVKPLRPVGRLSGLGMLGLLLLLLTTSLLRTDPAPYWRGIRLETWCALGLLGIYLIFVILYLLLTRLSKGRQPYFSL